MSCEMDLGSGEAYNIIARNPCEWKETRFSPRPGCRISAQIPFFTKRRSVMKPKILVTHKLLPEAMKILSEKHDFELATSGPILEKAELIDKIRDKSGVLCLLVDQIDSDVIDAAPDLKIIANCAVGFNNIDVEYAGRKGILVTNTPGVLTDTTADLTWALILSVARRIPEADRYSRSLKFKGWELDLFLGRDLPGKRLGIVGMGRIGRSVALRAQPFQMNVVYTDPHPLDPDEEQKLHALRLPLDELLATSDVITLHTTLTPETHHLISTDRLNRMKPEAILINVSRGPIVDEIALAEALRKRHIWGAGLDVYEREPAIEEALLNLDNVVLLPHIGSASIQTRLKMSMMAVSNLIQGLEGRKPDNLVT